MGYIDRRANSMPWRRSMLRTDRAFVVGCSQEQTSQDQESSTPIPRGNSARKFLAQGNQVEVRGRTTDSTPAPLQSIPVGGKPLLFPIGQCCIGQHIIS